MKVNTPGFKKVRATSEEVETFAAKNGHKPSVERSEHLCGQRIWHSGFAVGSHKRACPFYLGLDGQARVRNADGTVTLVAANSN